MKILKSFIKVVNNTLKLLKSKESFLNIICLFQIRIFLNQIETKNIKKKLAKTNIKLLNIFSKVT